MSNDTSAKPAVCACCGDARLVDPRRVLSPFYCWQCSPNIRARDARIAELEAFIDFMRDYHPCEVESCEAAYEKLCDQTKEVKE